MGRIAEAPDRVCTEENTQRYWYGQPGNTIPGGKGAADVALDAVSKVYSGERAWNRTHDPDLCKYLYDVVDSLIWSAVTSSENQETRFSSSDEVERKTAASNALSKDPSDDFVLGFYQDLEDEPDLQQIVECVIDGYVERADIAKRLGLPYSQMTNRRNRLERRHAAYRAAVYGMSASPPPSPDTAIRQTKGSISHAR